MKYAVEQVGAGRYEVRVNLFGALTRAGLEKFVMSDFVIRPRKGHTVIEPATEKDAEFFGIYKVDSDGAETWVADCVSREIAERFVGKAYALIEVRDGIAELTATKGDVEVAVVDWDNVNAGDPIDPELLDHPVFGPWIDADRS